MKAAEIKLTSKDHADLRRLEKDIERGLPTFLRIGRLLGEINQRHLYLCTHKSWEAYCEERWNMSRFYAYRLINASKKVDGIPVSVLTNGNTPVPQTESEARAMVFSEAEEESLCFADLPEEEQVKKAVETRNAWKEQAAAEEQPSEQERRYNRAVKHLQMALNALKGVRGAGSCVGIVQDCLAWLGAFEVQEDE